MIEKKHIPLSINISKSICIGVIRSEANVFFIPSNCLVRNKSPPSIFEFFEIWILEVFLWKKIQSVL